MVEICFHMTLRKQNAQCAYLTKEGSQIHRNMKIAWGDSAMKLGCCERTGLPLLASKRNQSKLSIVHSKGGQCNFWGCVTAMTGYHLDELVMICINFNGYTSLFFFVCCCFFSSFLFSTLLLLLTREYINYTSVSYGRILLPYISLQSDLAWKPSGLGQSISCSLWWYSSLLMLWYL